MSELLDHVGQCIQTRQLFHPGQRILVAVSGGVDSMVLLHLLHELAPKHGWQLTAAHLNHQLRGRSSDADERLVRSTAESLKLPVVIEGRGVRKLARTRGLSLEMAAREVRHGFLARTARRRRIPSVALAHHADDQLELFFLRLLRGNGGEGLAGMKWRSPSPSRPDIELVRPLLDQPKSVLVDYAVEHGICYREDASNAMLNYQRNRIRHELLPLLRSNYQPALDKTLSRVMDIVGADAEFAAQAACEWLRWAAGPKSKGQSPKEMRKARSGEIRASLGRRQRGKDGERKRRPFDDLPVAVQRRCVQLQLVSQGIVPDYELVEQLRIKTDQTVAIGRAQAPGAAQVGRAGRFPAAGAARRTGGMPVLLYAVRDRSGMVHLQAAGSEEFNSSSTEVGLAGGAGEIEFDGAVIWWQIDSREAVKPLRVGVRRESFDADKVGSPVWLRHWRPGDRFQPIGMACPVKLQDFFTNQKVPRDRRRRLIVAATASGEVFWVEGLRISERFKLTQQTIRRLQWRWKRL